MAIVVFDESSQAGEEKRMAGVKAVRQRDEADSKVGANQALAGPQESSCDACPHCNDRCGNPDCTSCSTKSEHVCSKLRFPFLGGADEKYFTLCEVRRHCTADSAWLLVGDTIYDATFYVSRHPGGTKSIVKKSGGKCDCAVDFDFHSKHARKMWKEHKIGKLCPCAKQLEGQQRESNQCTIS